MNAQNIFNYVKQLETENKALRKAIMDLVEREADKATSDVEATWEINCDGYYPYCSHCQHEPDRSLGSLGFLPAICPNCGAKMTNYKKFLH